MNNQRKDQEGSILSAWRVWVPVAAVSTVVAVQTAERTVYAKPMGCPTLKP